MTNELTITNAIGSYDWMWEGAEDALRKMGAEAYITEYLNNNEWSYQFPDFEGSSSELRAQVIEENLDAAIAEAQAWLEADAADTLAALAEAGNVIDVQVTYGGETKTADGRAVYNVPEYIAVTSEDINEDDGRLVYRISYHQGRMPAFNEEIFYSKAALVQAMIEIAPLSQWSEIEYE